MSRILAARAAVVTADAARYAKQLVAHLGRKVEFTTEGETSSAQFGDATGRILVAEAVYDVETATSRLRDALDAVLGTPVVTPAVPEGQAVQHVALQP